MNTQTQNRKQSLKKQNPSGEFTARAQSAFLFYAGVLAAALALAACNPNVSQMTDAPLVVSSGDADLFQKASIGDFGITGTKKIALTFDDGPGPGTASMLETLRKHGIRATFFMMGKSIEQNPQLLRQVYAEGHIIANHTYDHSCLTLKKFANDAALVAEVKKTHDLTAPYLNHQRHFYFRAPYGAWAAVRAGVLNGDPTLKLYIGPMFWNLGGELVRKNGTVESAADWDCWGKKLSVAQCLQGYVNETERHKGGVVLFHDIYNNTAKLAELYIEELEKRGYTFTNFDEMHGLDSLQ